jgi:2-amino-4-hydroxy-6-hydroxymethyldihydropteridine diphosphokinase
MGFLGPSGGEIRGIIAFIGIGSNLGNPVDNCQEAAEKIAAVPGIRFLHRSSLYRTEPLGPQDQAWFINAVVEIRTVLPPRPLFEALKEIERRMGRSEGAKWGPRIIDLDILLYGQEVIQEEGLVIPHPELHRRRFVLAPMCELASYLIHPVFGVSVCGLMDRLTDTGRVELYDSAETGG